MDETVDRLRVVGLKRTRQMLARPDYWGYPTLVLLAIPLAIYPDPIDRVVATFMPGVALMSGRSLLAVYLGALVVSAVVRMWYAVGVGEFRRLVLTFALSTAVVAIALVSHN